MPMTKIKEVCIEAMPGQDEYIDFVRNYISKFNVLMVVYDATSSPNNDYFKNILENANNSLLRSYCIITKTDLYENKNEKDFNEHDKYERAFKDLQNLPFMARMKEKENKVNNLRLEKKNKEEILEDLILNFPELTKFSKEGISKSLDINEINLFGAYPTPLALSNRDENSFMEAYNTLKLDLMNIFQMNELPLTVGIVGKGFVGKTALLKNLIYASKGELNNIGLEVRNGEAATDKIKTEITLITKKYQAKIDEIKDSDIEDKETKIKEIEIIKSIALRKSMSELKKEYDFLSKTIAPDLEIIRFEY